MSVSAKVKIINKSGLCLVTVSGFVKSIEKFKSRITLTVEDRKADARSILGLLTLAAFRGTEVLIEAEGPDEKAALKKVLDVIKNRLGEPE